MTMSGFSVRTIRRASRMDAFKLRSAAAFFLSPSRLTLRERPDTGSVKSGYPARLTSFSSMPPRAPANLMSHGSCFSK